MTRVFYSDYGEDPIRQAKIEKILAQLKAAGAKICRTSRRPLDTVALNLVLPNLIERSMHGAGVTLHPSADKTDDLLRIQAATFGYDNPKKSSGDCYTSMYMYRQYIEQELERFNPDLVILWHQFNAYHYCIAEWCKRKKVPILFGENGVLPGSWCFEFQGQMAESWISKQPEIFRNLPINGNDRRRAKHYLSAAVGKRLNRKAKGLSLSEAGLARKIESVQTPKILYAGVDDFKTGLQLYTRRRSLFHSGNFMSTEAGLMALLPLARPRGWHILYKAHPSIKHDTAALETYSDCLTIVDKRVDLIELLPHANALATIVSQSAYMALIHDTPVVLMGRMQLTGSDLVEETPFLDTLEAAIDRALADHSKAKRPELLRDHVARLLKYYLMSNEHGDKGLFGFDLSSVAETILQFTNASETKASRYGAGALN